MGSLSNLDKPINIYVYQVDDFNYGAGFLRRQCEQRGKIVEVLSVNSKEECRHIRSRGTNFGNAYDRVVKLAHIAEKSLGQLNRNDIDELQEGLLIDLNSLPWKRRLEVGWKIIRGKYRGEVNETTQTD